MSPFEIGKVSVVVPVFNEEQTLEPLSRRLLGVLSKTGYDYEVLLVDDGSSDASRERIEEICSSNPNFVGILLNRNYGQHPAVIAGLSHSRGDVVVTLDADLQNPPEEIPKLLVKVQEGHDVVGTVRRGRKDDSFRRSASSLVNYLIRKVTGVMMRDYGCMLRAYRRDVVDALLACKEHSTFVPVLANSFAGKSCDVEVEHCERSVGESRYNLWRLINLQFDLLTSMTTFPLRLLSVLGAFASFLGVSLGLLLLSMRLYYGPEWSVDGVFTLFALLFVFLGAQFLGLGLLGEYIGRIYSDVRARPRYFVQKFVGRRDS